MRIPAGDMQNWLAFDYSWILFENCGQSEKERNRRKEKVGLETNISREQRAKRRKQVTTGNPASYSGET